MGIVERGFQYWAPLDSNLDHLGKYRATWKHENLSNLNKPQNMASWVSLNMIFNTDHEINNF